MRKWIKIGVSVICCAAASTTWAQSCGDLIARDVVLTSDLVDCPAEGLSVMANNVTIDLNGHTISGSGSGSGIDVLASKGVRIIGPGALVNFGTGVAANNGKGHRISDLTMEQVETGVYWSDITQSSINDLYIKPQFNGLVLDGVGTQFNHVSGNYIEGGSGEAIWIRSGSDNTLTSNYLVRNQTGLAISGGHRNLFEHNHLIENGVGAMIAKGAAPIVGSAHSNRIVGNKIYYNRQGIYLEAYGSSDWMKYNVIERNAVRGGDEGLVISARNYKVMVHDNSFGSHRLNDIDDRGTRTQFRGNRCTGSPCP